MDGINTVTDTSIFKNMSECELDTFIGENKSSFEFYLSDEFGLVTDDTEQFVLNNAIDDGCEHDYKTAVLFKHRKII